MLLGLWLVLEIGSLSVLGSCMSHCWCLFLRMVEKERSRIRAVQMDNLRDLLIYQDHLIYQENECSDKGVVRSNEGCRRKD